MACNSFKSVRHWDDTNELVYHCTHLKQTIIPLHKMCSDSGNVYCGKATQSYSEQQLRYHLCRIHKTLIHTYMYVHSTYILRDMAF